MSHKYNEFTGVVLSTTPVSVQSTIGLVVEEAKRLGFELIGPVRVRLDFDFATHPRPSADFNVLSNHLYPHGVVIEEINEIPSVYLQENSLETQASLPLKKARDRGRR